MSKRLIYILLTVFLFAACAFPFRDYLGYLSGGSTESATWLMANETVVTSSTVTMIFLVVVIFTVSLSAFTALSGKFRLQLEGVLLISFGLFTALWAAEIFLPTSVVILNGNLQSVPSSFIYWFYAALVTFALLLAQYFLLRHRSSADGETE